MSVKSHGQRQKTCVICGQDCSDRPRVKDRRGRYYCRQCHEAAGRIRGATFTARNGTSPNGTPSNEIRNGAGDRSMLDEIVSQANNGRACPSCHRRIEAEAVICTNCGFSLETGRSVRCEVKAQPPARAVLGSAYGPPGLAGSTRWDDVAAHDRAEAAKAARWDYIIPSVMLAMGLSVIVARLVTSQGVGAVTTPAMATLAYLIVLGVQVVIGVIGVWVAVRLWLGGVGPLGLTLLRLAGIYAVADAAWAFVPGYVLLGFIVKAAIHLFLLSWLFELEGLESLQLWVITFVLKFLVGMALAIMLVSAMLA